MAVYYKGELYHHGIKGQRWGIRRFQKKDGTLTNAGKNRYSDDNKKGPSEAEQRKLAKAQKKWDKKATRNYITAYNNAADYANEVLIPKINKKYEKIMKTPNWSDDPHYEDYVKEYEESFNKVLNQKMVDLIGERPK